MKTSEKNKIWILGALGRSGKAIARELAAQGGSLVLVGRQELALRELASTLGIDADVIVAGTLEEIATAITRGSPRLVINTIGPFSRTALPLVRACPPGTDYVDVGNELPALLELAAMHEELAATNRCVVHGAGWGVLATESVVYRLCDGRPRPQYVRVDNVASVKTSGPLGHTLAEGILDGIAYGGRRYAGGKLKHAFAGSDHERFMLPDGTTASTGLIPSAELEAARVASGASHVVAGFPGTPGGLVRLAVPVLALLLRIPALRRFAASKIATLVPPSSMRDASWARARITWPDGMERTGWLRAGDGYDFLAKAAAGVAQRLLDGKGKPGCFTPGHLFGPELSKEAGGEFLLEADTGTSDTRPGH